MTDPTIPLDEIISDGATRPVSALELATKLANELTAKNAELAALEQAAKDIADRIRTIQERELPAAMKDAGMKSIGMEDGSSIEVEHQVFGSITKANQPEAYKWLIESGNSPIITPTVRIELDKGDVAKAAEIAEALRQNNEYGSQVAIENYIHPSTLRVFIRDMVESQRLLPEDKKTFPEKLFSVYSVDVAEVTPPKKPRRKKGDA